MGSIQYEKYKELNKHLHNSFETINHQKKVIDRLSRKIQRLKRDNKIIDSMCLAHWNLIDRQQKAILYIKQELSWAVGSEELIKILEGKDE